MTVQEAIKHYEYGITHDIFSEPVTTYAKMSIEALKKQIPKNPRVDNDDWYCCRNCGETFSLVNTLHKRNKYCGNCGQKISWEEGGTSD